MVTSPNWMAPFHIARAMLEPRCGSLACARRLGGDDSRLDATWQERGVARAERWVCRAVVPCRVVAGRRRVPRSPRRLARAVPTSLVESITAGDAIARRRVVSCQISRAVMQGACGAVGGVPI